MGLVPRGLHLGRNTTPAGFAQALINQGSHAVAAREIQESAPIDSRSGQRIDARLVGHGAGRGEERFEFAAEIRGVVHF